jgi:hypothetical protein
VINQLHRQSVRWLRLSIGLGLVAAILSFQAIALADVAPADVPEDLKAAIKAEVEYQGHQYAGLCKAIDQSANTPKYCANVLSMTATEAEVAYGPVASEPTAHIVFFKENGRWSHPGGGPGEGESGQIPSDLKAAIGKFLQGKGFDYAGLCNEIAQDGSTDGKYCANVSNLTATTASVSYGKVATNELTTVAFEKQNGSWALKTTVSNPVATPKPPDSGSGFIRDGGFNTDFAASAAVGVLLAVALGLFAVRRR